MGNKLLTSLNTSPSKQSQSNDKNQSKNISSQTQSPQNQSIDHKALLSKNSAITKKGHHKNFDEKTETTNQNVQYQFGDDDFFVEEGPTRGTDLRQEAKNNLVHPYNGVGRIVYTLQNLNDTKPEHGTGFLISTKHVLTNAHLFKVNSQFRKPVRFQFFPEPLSYVEQYEEGTGIQAKIIHMDDQYFSPQAPGESKIQKFIRSRYQDCVILQLAQNSRIRQQMVLKCNFEYSHQRDKPTEDIICIPGYPQIDQIHKLHPSDPPNNSLFYHQMPAMYQKPTGILYYEHSTSGGTSGAPLLLRKPNSYEVVGLHIGTHGNLNNGILFKSCSLKQTIKSLIKSKPPQILKRLHQRYLKSKPQITIEDDIECQTLVFYWQKFSNLRNIYLKSQKITDAGLIELALNGHNFNSLQEIGLSYNKITDEGLIALAQNGKNFNSLQKINLLCNKITDAGLIVLAQNGNKFKSLQTINLSQNKITDEGLIALAQNGHSFNSLQTINLWRNKITGAGLIKLAQNGNNFNSLQEISLSVNKITDAGLIALAQNGNKFKSLQKIYLSSSYITDAGKKQVVKLGEKIKFKILA